MTASQGALSGAEDWRSSTLGLGRAEAKQLGFLTRSSSSEEKRPIFFEEEGAIEKV